MLAELPPGTLDEWEAFDQVEPDADAALERIAGILQRGFELMLNAQGWKDVPKDLLEPDPKRRVGDCPEMMAPKDVGKTLQSFPQAW